MTDKEFLRKTLSVSHYYWRVGVVSRENAGIFLRGDSLRERSIARRIRRARIETEVPVRASPAASVSPGEFVGRGLKHWQPVIPRTIHSSIARRIRRARIETSPSASFGSGVPPYRPANSSGAD